MILRRKKDVSNAKAPDYREINLGGKNSTIVYKGDIFRILTPGGGGWGSRPAASSVTKRKAETISGSAKRFVPLAGGSLSNFAENQNSV